MKPASVSSFDPLALALPLVFGLLLTAFALAGWRLWRGPTAADRVLAVDLAGGCALALLIALALTFSLEALLDVALALGVIGFVTTVALARQLDRGGKDPS